MFSQQALDVVTATSGVSAVTTTTGNGISGSVVGGNLGFTNNQTMNGASVAQTDVRIGANAGNRLAVTTAATGNTSDTGVVNGVVQGVNTQAVGDTEINARTLIRGDNAQVRDATVATQAIANSQGIGVTHGSVGVRANQWNEAEVSADGGANWKYAPGTSVYSATATGNNLTSVGVNGSAAALIVGQHNYADTVTANQYATYANSQTTSTQATAVGNNGSISNQIGLLDVENAQENRAYVGAEASTDSYQFGSASVSAYGVGNSVLAGETGSEIRFDNTQSNTSGGVEAIASFNGHDGYDASVTATAVGNAATAYACSQCGGVMSVANSQTNDADVSARTYTTIGGPARQVVGVSTATGNTASFYVTSPTN